MPSSHPLTIFAHYQNGSSIPWGTYHYYQKPYVSWHQFAEAIVARAIEIGLVDYTVEVAPISSSEFPTSVKRPTNSRLDNSLLQAGFNISHTQLWSEDLSEVILTSL